MHTFKVTPLQRANALHALNDFWPTIKPEQVSGRLNYWRTERDCEGEPEFVDFDAPPTCGTVACFGGWVEWHAPFRRQMGLNPDKGEADIEALHGLFGTDSDSHTLNIFAERNWGFDGDIGFEGSDHELVSHRLRWLIDHSEMSACAVGTSAD